MDFQCETYDSMIEDLIPLLKDHHAEVCHEDDAPLNPDYASYKHMMDTGILKVFTARNHDGALCGYAFYYVNPSVQSKDVLRAHQDLIYLIPIFRGGGIGFRFLEYCDEQLKNMGVKVVLQNITHKVDFSRTLMRLGYKPIETVYSRRF